MDGPPGRSGQSAPSPVGQELNRGVGHAMQPVTPALDLPSRPASAAWADVTAVVRICLMSTVTFRFSSWLQ